MTRGKILYSSSFLYLTLPQFKALIPEMSEFKHILLNVNEPDNNLVDNKLIEEKNTSQYFDSYIKMRPKNEIMFTNLIFFIRYKKLLTEYLYKINPDAIISGSDMSLSDRVMFSWCKKKHVPFIILQPSFIEGFTEKYTLKYFMKYIIINKILNVPVFRKQYYYGNESEKSFLFLWSENFVYNPKRKNTFTLGNPAFDILFKKFSTERKLKKAIIICSDYLPSYILGNKIIDQINNIYLKAITSKPEITFYFKPHPREPLENYHNLFPKNKFPNVKIVENQDLYELFKLSDAQISVISFTSFEAAAMGLPVITIRPENKLKQYDFFRQEIDIRVTSEDEIVEAIDLCLSDEYWDLFIEKREEYFKKMLSTTDSQSSKRVANVIRQIITKTNNS